MCAILAKTTIYENKNTNRAVSQGVCFDIYGIVYKRDRLVHFSRILIDIRLYL